MASLAREAQALLDTISGPESKGNYGVVYGGGRISDYSDHPRQYVTITSGPNKGKKSSAAGKYQILASTWDAYAPKAGVTDFSPASQDAVAWTIASDEYRQDTGRDLLSDLKAGDLSRVPTSLKNQWTSLPGGIEQGIGSKAFSTAYNTNLGAEPKSDGGLLSSFWGGISGGINSAAEAAKKAGVGLGQVKINVPVGKLVDSYIANTIFKAPGRHVYDPDRDGPAENIQKYLNETVKLADGAIKQVQRLNPLWVQMQNKVHIPAIGLGQNVATAASGGKASSVTPVQSAPRSSNVASLPTLYRAGGYVYQPQAGGGFTKVGKLVPGLGGATASSGRSSGGGGGTQSFQSGGGHVYNSDTGSWERDLS